MISRWASSEAGVKFKVFPDAPEPAAKEVSRLRQMKELARRFKAHEMTGGRFELRLLPRQVHRYRDARSGLVDGAAFIWSRGSDPEILLMVELAKNDADVMKWQYAFARISNAELHVYLGDKEVWSIPTAGNQPTRTSGYALFAEALPFKP